MLMRLYVSFLIGVTRECVLSSQIMSSGWIVEPLRVDGQDFSMVWYITKVFLLELRITSMFLFAFFLSSCRVGKEQLPSWPPPKKEILLCFIGSSWFVLASLETDRSALKTSTS